MATEKLIAQGEFRRGDPDALDEKRHYVQLAAQQAVAQKALETGRLHTANLIAEEVRPSAADPACDTLVQTWDVTEVAAALRG